MKITRFLMRHECTTRAPRVRHECTTNAPRAHRECTTSAPRVHHDGTTSAPRAHHECTTMAPRVRQECTTSPPRVLMPHPLLESQTIEFFFDQINRIDGLMIIWTSSVKILLFLNFFAFFGAPKQSGKISKTIQKSRI